jgi:hypothetical protein
MQLLRREQRKTGGEVEPHLMPEYRPCAGAGAFSPVVALGKDTLQQVQILSHCASNRVLPEEYRLVLALSRLGDPAGL